MSRSISQRESNILYGMAAGRCSMEDCGEMLIITENNKTIHIGKMAHIVGNSPDGPRGDPNFPKDKLNKYENLILLCGTCHDKIDNDEDKYTVEKLHEIKSNHELRVNRKVDEAMSNFGFAELEVAAKAIASGIFTPKGDFKVIQPEVKIQKNNLSAKSRSMIATGLSKGHEVRTFLSKQSQIDPEFPERLKNGFQIKYTELKQTLDDDALFMAMVEFATYGTSDYNVYAAGLAILTHLFELCEVFEK